MKPTDDDISLKQAAHYESLLLKHGVSVDAVASARQEYKNLRYELLSGVFENDNHFTLHEIGFGLGHYYEFLKQCFPDRNISFSGSEVTSSFLEYCHQHYPDCKFDNHDFAASPTASMYDYVILAGVFYQLGKSSEDEFSEFVKRILRNAWASTNRGLAFNMITSHVDFRYDHLFYADPSETLFFVSQNLSRFIKINQSYPIFEYTVYVLKKEYIQSKFSDDCFNKYFEQKI
jgi:hypothetical protein